MQAKHVGIFGLVVALCAPMMGCTPKGRIAGVVVDWLTGEGLVGVTILVYQDEVIETTSDANGGFTVAIKDPEAILVLTKSGYKSADVLVGQEPVLVTDSTGQQSAKENKVSLTNVRMIPMNVALGGTVRYNNVGFDGAAVSVWCGGRFLSEVATDTAGGFSFVDLELCVENDVQVAYTLTAELDVDGDGSTDFNRTRTVSSVDGGLGSIDFDITGPQAGRTLSGHVFVDEWNPAVGSTVLLRTASSGEYAETTTGNDGEFSFPFDLDFNESYLIIGMPHDIDGDGWVDTGTDSVNLDWTSADNNILLDLPANAHGMPKSNVCQANAATHNILTGESLYFLWDSSINGDLLSYTLMDPHNQIIGSSESWVGNYLLEVAPSPQLTASSDPDDVYTIRFHGIVFEDGHVSVDPADPGDFMDCDFTVGTPPTFLASPQPSLFLENDEDSAVANASELWTYDADGDVMFIEGLDDVELTWPHVAGADQYKVFARQANGDIGSSVPFSTAWQQIGSDVNGDSIVNQSIYTSRDFAAPFNGGLGPDLGLSNSITIVVKPVDEDGHWSLPDGSEPSLVLADLISPELSGGGSSSGYDVLFGASQLHFDAMSLNFNENMDVNLALDGSVFAPIGGRLSGSSVEGIAYWGSSTPATVSNSAVFEEVVLDVTLGSQITLIGTPTADTVFDNTEIGAFSGYAIGQTIGFADLSSGSEAVFYEEITGLNTSAPSMTTTPSAFVPEAGDILFDPCASHDVLAAEAPEFTRDLVVSNGTRFFIGQTLVIGPETGTVSGTVESIAGNTLTLVGDLSSTQEIGSAVYDSTCFGGPGAGSLSLRAEGSLLNEQDNRLLTSTTVTSGTTSLRFNSSADFSRIVNGDWLWIDGDGDIGGKDTVVAQVNHIRTLNGDGTPREDSNSNPEWQLTFTNVTPLRSTQLPLTIDPTEAVIVALGDGFEISSTAVLTDTSGNGNIDPTRANVLILDDSGNGAFVIYSN